MPDSWAVYEWNAGAGFGTENGKRERIWFSPACINTAIQGDLFTTAAAAAR
jgi:hypothetical protein